jgi:hypothetical protein
LKLTAIIIVAGVAQRPAVGVNVYVVVPIAAVDIALFQVPVIPFKEVVGRIAGMAFKQYAPNCVNVGIILDETTTSIVVETAH